MINDSYKMQIIMKNAIIDWYWNEKVEGIDIKEVYVVWYSKTLQNHKALLAVNREDGLYFECTYNGDKNELYLDAYRKINNTLIPSTRFDVKVDY